MTGTIRLRNLPAFEARPRGGSDQFAKPVKVAFDFASFNFDLVAILGAQLGVETLRDAGQPAEAGMLVDGMPGDVVRHLADGALVARAAESGNVLFQTARNGRRAGLLEADDVAPEAEAEIAVVVARDLLGRDVNFAVKEAGAGRNDGIFRIFNVRYRRLRR